MPTQTIKRSVYAYFTIALVCCSTLMYEVLLTRICSLRLFFHFSYLIIANCMLGLGASGTLVYLTSKRWQNRRHFYLALSIGLYLASLVLGYLVMLKLHMPKATRFSDVEGLLRFAAFNVAAALPFFFSGCAVSMLLSAHGEEVNRIYFCDLLGASLGCLLAPWALVHFGAGGCLLAVLLGGVSALSLVWPGRAKRVAQAVCLVGAVAMLWGMPRLDKALPVPGKDTLDLTNKQTVDLARQAIFSRWGANSRIDLQKLTPEQRFIFCIGERAASQVPIPDQKFIAQDGSAGTYITNFSGHPESLALIKNSMYSATMRLKPAPRVFIIGVGGGNDVWAAHVAGASSVKAIELNQAILDIHHEVEPNFTRVLTQNPNIKLVCNEGRSALEHEQGQFDVIQMTGIDTWSALVSGAYMLAENYLYTKEAIQGMYDRLAPGGIMQITRMAADMEALRLMANMQAALAERGQQDLAPSVICLQTDRDSLMAAMLKKGPFTPEEIASTLAFARENGITPVYLPGQRLNTLVEQFLTTPDKAAFIRDFPRDITPTTDDKPFFFNFTKWSNPLKAKAYVSEPQQVSQGNPFFILGQLVIVLLLSLLLIVGPLCMVKRERIQGASVWRVLVYFAALGLGFISIEIGLMQKLTLLLGLPIYSLTVTLFSMLFFTGVGSLVLGPVFSTAQKRGVWIVPVGIALLLAAAIPGSTALVRGVIAEPLPVRILAAIGVLAPISLLLGVPFAYGVRRLNQLNPGLIPWAWAVNACCTVVGSILAMIVAMNLGFNCVLMLSGLIYLIGFAALPVGPAAPEAVTIQPAQPSRKAATPEAAAGIKS